MPVGATIGAAGALGSAAIGAYSSSKASEQQAAAQANALKQQKEMFDTAKGVVSPFITAGTNILPTLQGEITGGSGNTYADYLKQLLTPGQSASFLKDMPGFQFQSQYGTMAATNALAARGLAGGPGVLGRAISDYNSGLAGTQYFNTVNALQGAQGQRVGQLQNFANLGAGSAQSLAGNAIASGNAQAQTYGNIGNAQAAGTLGIGNALGGGLTGAGNAFGTNALIQKAAGIYGGKTPNAEVPSAAFMNNEWGW